jgi:spore germination cell wall hydrolase CwlJ-like protein
MALGVKWGSVVLAVSLVTGCALQDWQLAAVTSDAPVASAASAVVASAVTTTQYQFSQKDIDALILNAFNEARGEPVDGIRAVLGVTMARVESICYPDTVHDVVYQRKQFSWTWQRGSARTLSAAQSREPATYTRVKSVVEAFIAEGAKPSAAVLYHARGVNPSWSRAAEVDRVSVMGGHIFYDNRHC